MRKIAIVGANNFALVAALADTAMLADEANVHLVTLSDGYEPPLHLSPRVIDTYRAAPLPSKPRRAQTPNPERQAAAQAKRERRAARNRKLSVGHSG